jgi:hypothetical protein
VCVCVCVCAGHYERKMNVSTVMTFCVLAENKSTTLQAERIFPVQRLVPSLCVWLVFKTCCMPLGYFIYISFMIFLYGTRLSAWFCSRSLKFLRDFFSLFIISLFSFYHFSVFVFSFPLFVIHLPIYRLVRYSVFFVQHLCFSFLLFHFFGSSV